MTLSDVFDANSVIHHFVKAESGESRYLAIPWSFAISDSRHDKIRPEPRTLLDLTRRGEPNTHPGTLMRLIVTKTEDHLSSTDEIYDYFCLHSVLF
jgi:hypothetical protein